jgi:hypothetical protein
MGTRGVEIMMRMARSVCLPVLLLVFFLIGLGAALAQQGSAEQRQACAPDAMRLCSDAIPDVPRITKCMIAKYRQLSEPCQVAMRHGHKPYRHYYRRAYVHET